MSDAWPWLALAGLGLFHGINPAMGWLFAVALGLHCRSQRVVLVSLIPIALGHALAIAAVVALVMALGTLVDLTIFAALTGAGLIGWAVWHAARGHRHRVRVGMQTGLAGLAAWSFLMASAHGAGLMLIPALLPLQSGHAHHQGFANSSFAISLAAVVLHAAAMLLATGATAIVVYRWLDLAILKRAWINFDILWTAMLMLAGLILLWTAGGNGLFALSSGRAHRDCSDAIQGMLSDCGTHFAEPSGNGRSVSEVAVMIECKTLNRKRPPGLRTRSVSR